MTELLDLFDGNEEALSAYYILKETTTPIFLTGKAGTGKSTFLKLITSISKTTCTIVAPTGVAAYNVQGKTIHSTFHLPLHLVLPDDPLLKDIRFGKDDAIFHSDLLIIDEISMVTSAMLDCIDVILRQACQSPLPFGGKKVLFVGDPFQLAPIVKAEEKKLLKQYIKANIFFIQKCFKKLTH